MICSKCGNEIHSNGKFCRFCGNRINNKALCVRCGREVPEGYELCAECLKKNKSKSNKGLIAAVIILLALCAVVFVMLNGTFKTNKRDEPEDYENEVIETKLKEKEENEPEDSEDKEEYEYEDEEWGEPHFEEAVSSSEYKSYTDKTGKLHTYYVENLQDDNSETTWSPQKDDEMPWVKFSSYSEQKVSGIIIENGYSKSSDLYYQNLRAKDIIIECEDLEMAYTLKDLGYRTPEKITFYEPVISKYIKITVVSTYDSMKIDGVSYDDLSISKIEVF